MIKTSRTTKIILGIASIFIVVALSIFHSKKDMSVAKKKRLTL